MKVAPATTKAAPPVKYTLSFNGEKHQLFFRTFSGDLQIFYEVFWRKAYALPNVDLQSCRTIVDLGGNIGMSTLFFLLHAPGAYVWVLEPDGHNFSLLNKNLKDFHERIMLLHAGAAAQSGTIYLKQSRYAYNSATVQAKNGMPVPALGLNDLICQYNLDLIDLLKIDIEGFETVLFSGNTEWLQKVKRLIIEIHSEVAFTICSNVLREHQFRLCCVTGSFGGAGIYHACRSAESTAIPLISE